MRLSAPVWQLKRRAKLRSRSDKIPLHEAQDKIAREEGFSAWSILSSSRLAMNAPVLARLPRLSDGDMLLIGARPGQGKTLLGLELLLDATREGRRAVFFTLELTERESMEHIQSLDGNASGYAPEIVTSEEISADFIVGHLSGAPRRTVAVIDSLQILDQQRRKPELSDQLKVLQAFARRTGVILGFISQIDRSFEPESSPVPGLNDMRLPNPIPAGIFSKSCFLHADKMRLD